MQTMQTQVSTYNPSQFLSNLYGQTPTEGKEGKSTVYSLPIVNFIRVVIDPYGGCHLEIPQNADIRENTKEEITKLTRFICETNLYDSLWIDVKGDDKYPAKANIFGICPDSWDILDPKKGNVINDTQKGVMHIWQWLNADKTCSIPAGATHNLGATAAVIDESAQKILLVQNARRKDNWEMPGGSFESDKDNKESTLSTAVRECKEESGLDVSNKPASLIGQISFPYNQFAPAFNQVWKIIFNEGSTINPTPQQGETLRATWVSFDDVKVGVFAGLKIGPEVQAAAQATQGFFKLSASKEWMQLYYAP